MHPFTCGLTLRYGSGPVDGTVAFYNIARNVLYSVVGSPARLVKSINIIIITKIIILQFLIELTSPGFREH